VKLPEVCHTFQLVDIDAWQAYGNTVYTVPIYKTAVFDIELSCIFSRRERD